MSSEPNEKVLKSYRDFKLAIQSLEAITLPYSRYHKFYAHSLRKKTTLTRLTSRFCRFRRLNFHFRVHQKRKRKVVAAFLRALRARDQFEKSCLNSNKSKAILGLHERIKFWDDRLEALKWLYDYIDISEYYYLADPLPPKQWWLSPINILDKLDKPVFKPLTICFIGGFIALLVDIVPRFWAGGPSIVGVLAVIGPAFMLWLFGKEPLDRLLKLGGFLENCLRKHKIWRYLASEITFFLSLSFFLIALYLYLNKLPDISKHYFNKAYPDEKKCATSQILRNVSSVEANLLRALAFNPDNADAHFCLGWLYENRQDLDAAKKSYGLAYQNSSFDDEKKSKELAYQNSSFMAGIRLAGIHMNEGKSSSINLAAGLLKKIEPEAKKMLQLVDSEKENSFFYQYRSWVALFSEVRLSQKRYYESYDLVIEQGIFHEYDFLVKNKGNMDQLKEEYLLKGTGLYCIAAALYEDLEKLADKNMDAAKISNDRKLDWLSVERSVREINEITQQVSSPSNNRKIFLWQYCKQSLSKKDIDDDNWYGKALLHLQKLGIDSPELND
jgi:hypothetical protein